MNCDLGHVSLRVSQTWNGSRRIVSVVLSIRFWLSLDESWSKKQGGLKTKTNLEDLKHFQALMGFWLCDRIISSSYGDDLWRK